MGKKPAQSKAGRGIGSAVLGIALAGCQLAAWDNARADQGWEGHILNLTWENDATRGSDRHYTQGAKIGYLSADDIVPRWTRRLSGWIPAIGFEAERVKFTFETGQEIYTPEDLSAPELVRNDRPYAGWLYGSLGLQRRGRGPRDTAVIESLRFDLGLIGRESLAEDAQKTWHGRAPEGWDHQLKSEVAFAVRYERSYQLRVPLGRNWVFEEDPGLEAALGTLDMHAGIKAVSKLGYRVPDRYEVPSGPTPRQLGVYAFGSLGGRAVGHNLFLDGNTWRRSHHVSKETLLGIMSVGGTVLLGPVELTASNNYLTREFREQKNSDSFGSVTVSLKF